MNPQASVRALGDALQDLLTTHGKTARAASEALGFHGAFLTRAFRGHRPLRVEVVFRLLASLRELPYEFFDLHYPFAGDRLPAGQGPGPLDLPGEPTLAELVRGEYRRTRTLAPGEHRDDLAAWLRRAIRRAKASQKEISLRLGLGPYALGLALRGNSQLTFFHVFGVLDALGFDAGRMFFEVFLPRPASPLQGLRRERQLDAAEGIVRGTEQALAERRERRRQPAEAPAPEAPEGEEKPGNGR